MYGIIYTLNDQQIQQIEDALAKAPRNAEETINETIHLKGAKLIMQNIIGFIPLGARDTIKGKRKRHAKTSEPLDQKNFNLGVYIHNKPAFEYLLYPDLGIGKRNQVNQEFFYEGLQASGDTIFQWILEALDKNLGGI